MPSARVIVDTNVLISRLLIPHSVAGRAVSHLIKITRLLVSEDTLAALAQTIVRDKFNPYVSLEDRQEFFRLYARLAEWVPISSTVRACRDPKDDKFLELAVDGQAQMLVTGDKDLLALSPYRDMQIVTPAAALALPDAALLIGSTNVP
jgi:putative PIN family toxin of toxin-antitoxin system